MSHEEETVYLTLDQALDKAVDRMPLFRRAATKWKVSRPRKREKILQELRVDLHDDHRATAMGFAPIFGDDSFDVHETEFGIDTENLAEFLDLILEYLPRIIEMVMAFFMLLIVCGALAYGATSTTTVATAGQEVNPLTRAEMQADAPPIPQPVIIDAFDVGAVCDPATGNCSPAGAFASCEPRAAIAPAPRRRLFQRPAPPVLQLSEQSCGSEAPRLYSSSAEDYLSYQTYSESSCGMEAMGATDGGVVLYRAGPVQSRLSERPLIQRFRQRDGPLRRLFGGRLFGGRCGR